MPSERRARRSFYEALRRLRQSQGFVMVVAAACLKRVRVQASIAVKVIIILIIAFIVHLIQIMMH